MGYGIEGKKKLSDKRIEELQTNYGTPEETAFAKTLPQPLQKLDKVKVGDIPIVGRVIKKLGQ